MAVRRGDKHLAIFRETKFPSAGRHLVEFGFGRVLLKDLAPHTSLSDLLADS